MAMLDLLAGAPLLANAQQIPGNYPGYLHALPDLRSARWFPYLQPGDAKVSASEEAAIAKIDAAIGEIKRAPMDDDKDLSEHPKIEVKERGSGLLRYKETLGKAREDMAEEEDKPESRELGQKAHDHSDRAIRAAERAHADWLQEATR